MIGSMSQARRHVATQGAEIVALREQAMVLRAEIGQLKHENAGLRNLISGDRAMGISWLMAKVANQRRALDILNRRVVAQRLVLRTLNELGRGLTQEEWAEAKSRWTHPSTGREALAERLPRDVSKLSS